MGLPVTFGRTLLFSEADRAPSGEPRPASLGNWFSPWSLSGACYAAHCAGLRVCTMVTYVSAMFVLAYAVDTLPSLLVGRLW